MLVNCAVACADAEGDGAFYFCRVRCTEAEYAAKLYRSVANEEAAKAGYRPFWTYAEEHDASIWLFGQCEWHLTRIVTTQEVQAKEQLIRQVSRLVVAIEDVQDWKGTRVGDEIEALQPFLVLPS